MPKINPSIQPLGWGVPRELPDELRYVQMISLPKPIYDSLGSLEKPAERVPPITSLHDVLAAHSSAIIAFHPHALSAENSERRWLYAYPDSLNSSRLPTFLRMWLTVCYDVERAQSITESWGACYWDSQVVDLQTADDDLKKLLLPGLAARWLMTQGFELTLKSKDGDHRIPLHLVQLMTARNTVELISDPQAYGDEIGSFVLRFWLENRPQTRALCLLHRLSVRRWVHRSMVTDYDDYVFVSLPKYQNRSVFVHGRTGYLDREKPTDVFSRIRLRMVSYSGEKVQWIGQQAALLERLQLEPIPSALDLLRDPPVYRNQLLVTRDHKNQEQIGKRTSLGTGLYANDHRRGFHDISAYLGTAFVPLPVGRRVVDGDARAWGRLTISQKAIREANPQARWDALRCLPYPLKIELHVDDPATAKRELLEIVGATTIVEQGDTTSVLVDDRLLMEFAICHDKGLTQLLDEGAAFIGEKTDKRRREITSRYRKAEQPTGALIELSDYRKYKKSERDRDPKRAIRLGLIDSGRVSQFMVPKGTYKSDEKSAKENHKANYVLRVEQAARDLMRTLGYRYNPFYTPPAKFVLPSEIDLVGFYVIQLNARRWGDDTIKLPLMVEAPFGHPHIRLTLPSITGRARVYPSLREGLIAAAQLEQDYAGISEEAFFREALTQRNTIRPTLLLLAEQNLRRVFAELGNQRGTALVSLNGLLDHQPQIRVARLRKSSDFEAPFCVSAGRMSRYQGLYQTDLPTVFYSLHDLRRRSRREDRKQDRPGEAAATPSTLQIWMSNLRADDDPRSWAALVHRLRLESSHTDNPTVLPQPLHDALKLREYLSGAVEEVDLIDDEGAGD